MSAFTTNEQDVQPLPTENGTQVASDPPADFRRRVATGLSGPWRVIPLVLGLVLVWIFFAIQSPLFLSSRNLTNLSNQIAVSSVLSLGLVFVIVIRRIDISLASLSAVCGGLAAHLSVLEGLNPVLAVGTVLVVGMCVSVIQAWIMLKSNTPAFIVTLGGMFILNAALLWMLPVTQVFVLSGTPLEAIARTYLPAWLSYLFAVCVIAGFGLLRWGYHAERIRAGLSSRLLQSTILPTAAIAVGSFAVLIRVFNSYRGMPLPAVIVVGFAIVLSYITTQTPLGRHIFAIGGNPEAARRAGIKVGGLTLLAYSIAGFAAATAGVINASRSLGVSAQSTDLTLLLGAISALVIGGVSLFGGRGGIWPVVLGGILVGSIQNGLQLIAASLPVQLTVQGVVLVSAVVVDSLISKQSVNPT